MIDEDKNTMMDTMTNTMTNTTNVKVIKGEELFQRTIERTKRTNRLLIVNFGAEWCKHCHKLSPIMFDLAEKYNHHRTTTTTMNMNTFKHGGEGIDFVFTDVDLLPTSAKDVRWTPTVSIFCKGRKIDEIEQCNEQQLKDRVWLWSDALESSRFDSRG